MRNFADLERLNKRPEKYPDCVSLAKKLDKPGRSKQAKETDVEEVALLTNIHGITSLKLGLDVRLLKKNSLNDTYPNFNSQRIDNAPEDSDEVERVPRILEKVLLARNMTKAIVVY